jgi:hypothetical protein
MKIRGGEDRDDSVERGTEGNKGYEQKKKEEGANK